MTTPASTLPLAQDIGWTAGTITGRIKAPDGSISSPGYQFRDDPDSGFRRVSANKVAIVVAGFDAVQIDASNASFNVNQLGAGAIASGWRDLLTARTGDATLSATTDVGTWNTNTGATGEVILTLPASATGRRFMFAVDAAQYLRVKAAGTDTIRDAATVSAAAGYIRANVAGNVLEVTCIASGKWYVTSKTGIWTVDA